MRCLPTKQGHWYKCTRCGNTWGDSYGSVPLCSYREPTPYIKEVPLDLDPPQVPYQSVEEIMAMGDIFFKPRASKLDKLTVI